MASNKIVKVCIDRHLPAKTVVERMALVRDSKWQPGDAIVVSFLDGDPGVQERVKQYAKVWMDYANLQINFRQEATADIRISFTQRGSWSQIGTDCHRVPAGQATMNYGWLTSATDEDEVSRVVLHEFGHALGCIHEHQNPDGGIEWDKEAVYAYYAGSPNYWSRAQVDLNIFQTYDKNLTLFTKVDPQSIMMYPIDASLTGGQFSVGWNRTLSETDKVFIRQMYP
jgi:serralysin